MRKSVPLALGAAWLMHTGGRQIRAFVPTPPVRHRAVASLPVTTTWTIGGGTVTAPPVLAALSQDQLSLPEASDRSLGALDCRATAGNEAWSGLPPWRPALPPARNVAVNNCDSIPRIAVVDDFRRAVVDINKDGTKDFPHGVVVEAILRAFLPGTEVLRFGSATTTIPAELVVEQFRIIRAAVLGGRRIDAVNLSLGWNMPLHILRRLTGVDGLSPDSLQRDVPAVRRWALADTKFPNLAEALRAIEQVTALGVPVYVAAGNKGSHFANLFCFAEGVVPVAATCRHGHVLPSSAESSICVWAEGRFGVRRVPGGYDLNFSGEPDLPLIPGGVGPLVVEQWADKPVHDVVTTHPIDVARMLRARRQPQEVPLSDPLRAKLFDVEGVARQGGLEPEELERMRRCGSRFIDFSGRLRFRERAGRIVYDPGNSGESGAIGVVRGTSFAAPVALAHDWKARHC